MKIHWVTLIPILSIAAFAAGFDFDTIPRPPLPPDPLELVASDAQPVQDAQQRIAALGLLIRRTTSPMFARSPMI